MDESEIGSLPRDQSHIHLPGMFTVDEGLDQGGRQKQRTDQILVRVRLSRNVIGDCLLNRRQAGWENGSVVDQGAEQRSFGRVLRPDAD